MKRIILGSVCLSIAALASCGDSAPKDDAAPAAGIVSAEGDFATNLQTALIEAVSGSTVELPEGHFQLETGLSLDVNGITLIGAGSDKTILDFSGQTGAGEGLLVTSDDVTLAEFSIRDTKGDGIKSKGADRITYRDLIVEWSGDPDESNGAYGVYPVESRDVLIERVVVRGASDAGIYVGQSKNIIVRNSVAEYNVAGIEIENSMNADVYGNIAQHNTGGILVFDLPDLPQTGGHSTRIFDNQIIDNNTRNFAPAGNIVAGVPSGTGVIIMANRNVHVFSNNFSNNRSAHILMTAYPEPFRDETYNPVPRNVVLVGNSYSGGGDDPQGMLQPIAEAMGGILPEIVSDGVVAWEGGSVPTTNISIQEDESVGFIDLGIGKYPADPTSIAPSNQRPDAAPAEQPSAVVLPQDEN